MFGSETRKALSLQAQGAPRDVSAAAAHGTASVDADGTWHYTVTDAGAVDALAVGEHLSDSFTVQVDDHNGGVATQVVNITIVGTNDAPVVRAAVTGAGDEDTTFSVNLLQNASDVDHGAVLHVANVTWDEVPGNLPAGFALSANALTVDATGLAYQGLAQGETFTIHFTYDVVDEHGAAVTQHATITIVGTNDAPVAVADITGGVVESGVAVGSNMPLAGNPTATGNVLTNDTDVDHGDTTTVTTTGDFTGIYGTLHLNANGSYTYTLNNADADTNALAQGETAPVAVNDSASGNEDTAITTGNVLANDSDVDNTLTVASINAFTQGAHGAVVNNGNGTFTYTPVANFNGSDSFTYTVTDGSLTSTATVNITVNAVNDAPVVTGAVLGDATEDGAAVPLNALANAGDVDGNTLSVVSVPGTLPAGVVYNTATHTFTLDPTNNAFQPLSQGQTTTVSVSYGVSDGTVTTPAQATWTVHGTNDPSVVTGGDFAGAILEADRGSAPSAPTTPVFNETEPNNSIAQAQLIDLSLLRIAPNSFLYDQTVPAITVQGTVTTITDSDFYKLNLTQGQFLTLDVDTNTTPLKLDSFLSLLNASGTVIASLEFHGYGTGASFTQIDSIHWEVNYSAGTQHEIITFDNAPVITPNDYQFFAT